MRQTICFAVALALALVMAPVASGAAQSADKNAEKAKQACEAFAKQVVAKDMPALMKVVDVPWCDNINLDETKLIQKSDELKKRLEKLIGGSAQIPPKVVLEFKTVLTYEKVLEKFGGGLSAEERKILDQVLKKTDYVVHVVIKSAEGEILTQLSMLIGFRDGQAKVVGLRSS
jgi:hypothetical protein